MVRRKYTRQLSKNLNKILREHDSLMQIKREWDVIEVDSSLLKLNEIAKFDSRLRCIPGVGRIHKVRKYPIPPMEDMFHLARDAYDKILKGKTFAVRCRRMGEHSFTSVEVERYVGERIRAECETAGVKLKSPDVTVLLEIRNDFFYVVTEKFFGLGGFPLGCQDSVISMISGGFDSSVSSYLSIKRGLLAHYCFFNLGGKEHELAVKEIALFLWLKFHTSHRVKFVSVSFEPVLEEILRQVESPYVPVILKRMMLRAGDKVARKLGINTIVTGESIGQVSSQTLANLSIIDRASTSLILRPLCFHDKQEIINTAREIGTEGFSKRVPEYCGVTSKNPTTKAKLSKVEREESRLNMALLEEAVTKANYQSITALPDVFGEESTHIEVVKLPQGRSTVIDIRHPNEEQRSPLRLGKEIRIIKIPFYDLRMYSEKLEQDGRYLLYCAHGMMSRLQAVYLTNKGYRNIAILDLGNLENKI